MSLTLLRNIHTEVLSPENTDKEQNKLFKKLSDINKGENPIEKKLFLESIRFLLEQEKMLLIVSKLIYFN